MENKFPESEVQELFVCVCTCAVGFGWVITQIPYVNCQLFQESTLILSFHKVEQRIEEAWFQRGKEAWMALG